MCIKKSIWKFPFNQIKYSINFKEKVLNRNTTLTTKFLDRRFKCHKGNVIGKLYITKQHLGHKFGEFFVTKVIGDRIAFRKRQKLLLKKSKNKQKLIKKV